MRATLVLLVLLLSPPATQAQQVAKPWRVGYLSAGFPRPGLEKVFVATMRELGYVEGRNLVLESRYADGTFGRLPELALALVRLGPDVLVAVGSAETQALQRATTTIPIVMIVVPDPVGLGIVTSLARPGGNVTGLTSTPGLELYGKRLELLRDLVPGASRIALLVNPGSSMTDSVVRQTEAAAKALGVQLRIVEVRTRNELPETFSLMKQNGDPSPQGAGRSAVQCRPGPPGRVGRTDSHPRRV